VHAATTAETNVIAPVPRRSAPVNRFGPGLVAAASNNDPTTVAALAVVGATTGYALCWLVVLVVPMLALVQALAADVGVVCRTSLQGAIRRHYGLGWAITTLVAVVAVNLFTLAADVKAGSEALALLVHVPAAIFVVPFVTGVGALLVARSFSSIERYLTLMPLAFVCYVASAVIAHADGAAFLRSILMPRYALSPLEAGGAIALLGTTLTGYVYMWESIGIAQRRASRASIRFFAWDAALGMVAVGVIFVFILVASAATLGTHGVNVQTASDMAAALEPLAGPWAGTLFGVGLLASSILAVPVLASTTAYVVAHTFGWRGSLDASPREAPAFYGVVIAALALAAMGAYAPVSPVAMLYAASIAGGLATPLTLAFLVLIAASRAIMGRDAIGRTVAGLAWTVTAIVGSAAVGFLISSFTQRT
jgi:Mn2+/Fe2+ NRAMP family transporter